MYKGCSAKKKLTHIFTGEDCTPDRHGWLHLVFVLLFLLQLHEVPLLLLRLHLINHRQQRNKHTHRGLYTTGHHTITKQELTWARVPVCFDLDFMRFLNSSEFSSMLPRSLERFTGGSSGFSFSSTVFSAKSLTTYKNP